MSVDVVVSSGAGGVGQRLQALADISRLVTAALEPQARLDAAVEATGSGSAGSGAGIADGPGSRGGSACSSASTGWTAARTTAPTGWSAGSGWGC